MFQHLTVTRASFAALLIAFAMASSANAACTSKFGCNTVTAPGAKSTSYGIKSGSAKQTSYGLTSGKQTSYGVTSGKQTSYGVKSSGAKQTSYGLTSGKQTSYGVTSGKSTSYGVTSGKKTSTGVMGANCRQTGFGIVCSDVRLKRDIAALGRLDNGLTLYSYRYLWSEQVYVGVMAQDVAAVAPQAVTRGSDGYLRVDYSQLGLRLQTIEEWNAASRS